MGLEKSRGSKLDITRPIITIYINVALSHKFAIHSLIYTTTAFLRSTLI